MDFEDEDDAVFSAFDIDAAVMQHREKCTSTPIDSNAEKENILQSKRQVGEDTATKQEEEERLKRRQSDEFTKLTGCTVRELKTTLADYFGHDEFRTGQQEIVTGIMSGRDCAVFWATGSGKSVCYQLPALHLRKTVLVVSPLISLMEDQVKTLNAKSGRGRTIATFLGTGQTDSTVERRAFEGEFWLLYASPEKCLQEGFLSKLVELHRRGRLAMIAVDEAHCVSQWGHDFRPEYSQLHCLRERVPAVPIMVLTATAVPAVQRDIASQLKMKDPLIATQSFDRVNLTIQVHRKQTIAQSLLPLAKLMATEARSSTIVYVPTIKECETVEQYLADYLHTAGKVVMRYTGACMSRCCPHKVKYRGLGKSNEGERG